MTEYAYVDGDLVELLPDEVVEIRAIQAALSTPLPPTIDHYRQAIQAFVDETAQQRNYDSGLTCASYVGSTNPAWAAEAAAFVAWRDVVWAYAYGELDKVQAGQRSQPTVAEMIGELPELIWPA